MTKIDHYLTSFNFLMLPKQIGWPDYTQLGAQIPHMECQNFWNNFFRCVTKNDVTHSFHLMPKFEKPKNVPYVIPDLYLAFPNFPSGFKPNQISRSFKHFSWQNADFHSSPCERECSPKKKALWFRSLTIDAWSYYSTTQLYKYQL